MFRRVASHVRDQWMGALALFLVVAGSSAYAANTVFSSDIVDGQVKTADLDNGAVSVAKIADGSITGDKVKDGAIQGRDVLDNNLKGTDIDESTLSNIGGGGPAGGDLEGDFPNPEIKAGAVGPDEILDDSLTEADLSLATRLRLQTDARAKSVDPAQDPLLSASAGVPISTTLNLTAGFTPVVIASLDVFSSTTIGQAHCHLRTGTTRISQDAFVDFGFANDDEQLTLIGEYGESVNGSGSGLLEDIETTIDVKCTVDSGTIRFDRGDLVVVALPV